MPLNLPKGFKRRKSSGNALEDVGAAPQSSFKVLTRDEAQQRATATDGEKAARRMSIGRPFSSPIQRVTQQRQQSFDEDSGASNRGSGSSAANSALSRFYDTSSHSTRYSSSSTLPSSTDLDLPEKAAQLHRSSNSDSRTFSLRNAVRPFTKIHRSSLSAIAPPELDDVISQGQSSGSTVRDRAMTTSSYASTAIPPKLDAELHFGSSDFSNMFESMGRKQSAIWDQSETAAQAFNGRDTTPGAVSSDYSDQTSPHDGPQRNLAPSSKLSGIRANNTPPPPILIDRSRDVASSPYSWDSRDSQDGLMSSPADSSPNPEKAPPIPTHSEFASAGSPSPDRLARLYLRDDSESIEDEDAKIVMSSVRAKRASSQSPDSKLGTPARNRQITGDKKPASHVRISPSSSDFSLETPSTASADSRLHASYKPRSQTLARQTTPTALYTDSSSISNDTTPRAKNAVPHTEDEEPLFDQTTAGAIRSSVDKAPAVKPGGQNQKVMTGAEFERYKKEKEMSTQGDDSDSASEESEAYDYEDEMELNRKIAARRRKQASDLVLHRQMMRKITGQQDLDPSASVRPPAARANLSVPNLPATLPLDQSAGPSNSGNADTFADDDDPTDSVPLEILRAHGFPRANRPPSHLHNSNSSGNLRSASQQTAKPAVPGPAVASLAGVDLSKQPDWANKFPIDPYGLVTQPNREPLNFNRRGNETVYGAPTPVALGTPPRATPGGLIGVIVEEERARGLRRGSPNANGTYGPLPSQMPVSMPIQPQMPMMGSNPQMGMPMAPMGQMGMGMPGMGMTPEQQMMFSMAQLQQQNQMLQQQMMMGQQFGMQGFQQPQQMLPQMNNFLAPPPAPSARPMSMASNASTMPYQRSMSMVNMGGGLAPPQFNARPPMNNYAPSIHGLNIQQNQGYAPSIAPSERSNIGQSSRYRPVALGSNENQSTTTSHTVTGPPPVREMPLGKPRDKRGVIATVRASIRPNKPPRFAIDGAGDDSEDDEGWADVRKRRSETNGRKQSPGPGLKDVYHGDT